MLKQILCLCTVVIMPLIAMEQPIQLVPHIVYNTNNSPYALEAKLTEQFSISSKCPKEQEEFSHQSPQISRIHSRDYLNNLDQCSSTMLAAINNNYKMALYPNRYSRSYLPPMLDNVSTTFAATECVILVNNITRFKPNYAIALAEGYSFAGHNCGNNGHVYAPIPIAAAYALEEHNHDIKRILVIDENITTNTVEYYFKNGNGSIFFPQNNPRLSQLFNNKIVIDNRIPDELWDFLHNPHDNKIDLAFYNINIDDVEPINGLKPADAKERVLKIWSLFYHFIPTVFILSGDKNGHQDATYSLIEYIAATARKIASFNPPQEVTQSSTEVPSDIEWEQIKNDCIKAAQNLMGYLENKYSLPASTEPLTNDLLNKSSSSQSLSSSCSDLEQEQHRLKKRLGLSFSSGHEGDNEGAESSSTYDYGNDSPSCEDNNDDENKI